MRKQNKRYLYESIMRDVAKVVKRRLNEGMYDFDYSNTVDFDDDYVRGRERKENNRQERIANLKSRYETVDTRGNGLTIIANENGKYNIINSDGCLIFDKWWLVDVDEFKNGYAKVYMASQSQGLIINFIDMDGKIVSKEWFVDAGNFHDGFARVEKVIKYAKRWNFIDTNGHFISEDWFDDVSNFKDGYAIVSVDRENGHKENVINTSGYLMVDIWYDRCCPKSNGEIMVMRGAGSDIQIGKYDSHGRFNGKWRDVDMTSSEYDFFLKKRKIFFNR